jgi:hypothetical protein
LYPLPVVAIYLELGGRTTLPFLLVTTAGLILPTRDDRGFNPLAVVVGYHEGSATHGHDLGQAGVRHTVTVLQLQPTEIGGERRGSVREKQLLILLQHRHSYLPLYPDTDTVTSLK